jgi:hypothetical protein
VPARSMVAITGLTLCAALGGCASVPHKSAPCYDGWTTDGRGGSSRVFRDEALLADLAASFIPPKRALSCAHVSFNGNIILLFFDPPSLRYTEVSKGADGKFSIAAEGIVVGGSPRR